MAPSGLVAGLFTTDSGPGASGAPPLVLVHGAGGTYRHWPAEIRHMPGQRVMALDLPGHGGSPLPGRQSVEAYARSVQEVIDELRLEAAVIAGHSMGGAIALTLALESPERVAGLVLVGTGARLRVVPAILEAAADPGASEQVASLMAEFSFAARAGEALRQDFVTGMRANAPGILHGDLSACDRFDVMGRLGEIRAPALVLRGADDKLTPSKYAVFLRDGIPDARLELVPEAGHMVMIEAARAVGDSMAAFVRSAFRGRS